MPESAPERGITAPTVLERVTVALANYIADDARPTPGAVAACREAAQLLWGPRQKAIAAAVMCESNPRIDGEPWEPWEGNGPCQDCGARNVVWFTDTRLGLPSWATRVACSARRASSSALTGPDSQRCGRWHLMSNQSCPDRQGRCTCIPQPWWRRFLWRLLNG